MYLDECLRSLLDQEIETDDLEVIMIDDGSTDGSNLIAEQWAKRHKNFKMFYQENSGLSAARNNGVKKSTGKYITFLDSDDLIYPMGYKKMLNIINETDSDFITSPTYRFTGGKTFVPFNRNFDLYKKTKKSLSIKDNPQYIRDFLPCDKIYNREFFIDSGVEFPENRIYEDIATIPVVYAKSRKFDVYSGYVYLWRMRGSESLPSLTQTRTNPKKSYDRIKSLEEIYEFIHSDSDYEVLIDQYDFAMIDYNIRWILLDIKFYDDQTRTDVIKRIASLINKTDSKIDAQLQPQLKEIVKLFRQNKLLQLDKKLIKLTTIPDLVVGTDEYISGNVRSATREKKSAIKTLRELRKKKNIAKDNLKNIKSLVLTRQLYRCMPILDDHAVFSSIWGQHFGTNYGPSQLCLDLMKHNKDITCIIFADKQSAKRIKNNVRKLAPSGAKYKVVINNTKDYYKYLERSKYLFNDVNFRVGINGHFVNKRKEQIEVQTTHGIPLKNMGIMAKGQDAIPEHGLKNYLAKCRRYDYLVSSSESVAHIFEKAFDVKPKILKTGLPQNDYLFKDLDKKDLVRLRHKYGIQDDKKVIVYAPTFREVDSAFRYLIDFDVLYQKFHKDYQIIIKTHPASHTNLNMINFLNISNYKRGGYPSDSRDNFVNILGAVRGAKTHFNSIKLGALVQLIHGNVQYNEADVNELMRIADVFITDYSSTMFNYTHLNKAAIFFTPDIDIYNERRGIYFDIDRKSPGAVAKNTQDIIEAINLSEKKDQWNKKYGEKIDEFKKEFLDWEKGNASEAILRQIGLI